MLLGNKLAIVSALVSLPALSEPIQNIAAPPLKFAPKIDGKLADWGGDGWVTIPVKPALDRTERIRLGLDPSDDKNHTGRLDVALKVGSHGGRLYFAVRYPDPAPDLEYRMWEWRGDKYTEGKQREDMFALRFHLDGEFDRSMLSTKDYKADVWQWSSARTNPSGTAEDMVHHMTTKMLDSAAEYTLPDGKTTIYIKKTRDEGNAPYRMLPRPKERRGDKLPSYEIAPASGSAADVAAKGEWSNGYWHIEFSRQLNTGHTDDVVFRTGSRVLTQLAVFNKGYSEHKSVSEPFLLEFR